MPYPVLTNVALNSNVAPVASCASRLCRLENPIPTNILILTMAIDREGEDGIQQVIFYDSGVGTQGAVDKV